jgi:O-antigen/teichoic acid export membrane protein
MSKIDKRRIIKNVGSSWFSLSTDVAVGIFLSPFILHRLGDAAFGVWILIFSLTGYYGLFDLGIRSSVVRYVSKFTATGDTEDLGKLVNTSIFSYSCVGLLSFLVTAVLSIYVDRIFKIPPELHAVARWLLLMVGASVGLGFPLGVVGGFLDGLQRFDVNNWAGVAANFARAALIVLALHRGLGLLTIAAITVIIPLITSVIRGVIAFHIQPVPFGFKYVDRGTFRMIANYSSATLVIMIATQLKFKSDNVVIATMISATAVTYFSIGSRIVSYAQQVVMALAQNFLPIASQSEATGNMDRLRKVFVAGNRFCALTCFPITATLVILGKSVIEVWVGKRYVATSYPVLLILIFPATLMWAQAASGRVLFGISKHRTWGFVTLSEGIVNLILSIVLVHYFQRAGHGPYYGIYGDALGTAIPLACTMTLFMPWHLCRQLGIRMRTYLREAYVLPLLITAPLVGALLLMRRWFQPHSYPQLALQLLIAAVVYGLGLLWVVASKRAFRVGDLGSEENPVATIDGIDTAVEAYQQDV